MSQCTCTTDKEITCIVHPTDRAMKEVITKLETENAKLEEAAQAVVETMRGSGGINPDAAEALLNLAALLGSE